MNPDLLSDMSGQAQNLASANERRQMKENYPQWDSPLFMRSFLGKKNGILSGFLGQKK